LSERLRSFEQRLADYDQQILYFARRDARTVRLMAVPGVGPLIATALIAAVGDARQFKSGRQLSAWLGLVPREHSSGEREILLGFSKCGDRYLRTLLIHGARSTLYYVARKRDRRSVWLTGLRERSGANIAAVVLANKNARVLWAILSRNEEFRTPAGA
jgi:transposase